VRIARMSEGLLLMKKATIEISGMSCQHCVGRVNQALEAQGGVEVDAVQVGRAEVRIDPHRVGREELAAVLDVVGFALVGYSEG
jgi:copper chaperone